jgi:hypothetical protein
MCSPDIRASISIKSKPQKSGSARSIATKYEGGPIAALRSSRINHAADNEKALLCHEISLLAHTEPDLCAALKGEIFAGGSLLCHYLKVKRCKFHVCWGRDGRGDPFLGDEMYRVTILLRKLHFGCNNTLGRRKKARKVAIASPFSHALLGRRRKFFRRFPYQLATIRAEAKSIGTAVKINSLCQPE